MTIEKTLQKLRNKNIDIEISCVFSNKTEGQIKIGYRYIISLWNEKNALIRNIYTDDIYETYEDAVIAALSRVHTELNITL